MKRRRGEVGWRGGSKRGGRGKIGLVKPWVSGGRERCRRKGRRRERERTKGKIRWSFSRISFFFMNHLCNFHSFDDGGISHGEAWGGGK